MWVKVAENPTDLVSADLIRTGRNQRFLGAIWLIGLVWQKNMYLFSVPVYPVVCFRPQVFCLCMFCFLNWFGNGIKSFFFLWSAVSFEDDSSLLSHVFSLQSVFFLLLMTDLNNHFIKKKKRNVNTMLNVSGSWDRVVACWYRHHLLTGDTFSFESISPKADYWVSAAASLSHHNPCMKINK